MKLEVISPEFDKMSSSAGVASLILELNLEGAANRKFTVRNHRIALVSDVLVGGFRGWIWLVRALHAKNVTRRSNLRVQVSSSRPHSGRDSRPVLILSLLKSILDRHNDYQSLTHVTDFRRPSRPPHARTHHLNLVMHKEYRVSAQFGSLAPQLILDFLGRDAVIGRSSNLSELVEGARRLRLKDLHLGRI